MALCNLIIYTKEKERKKERNKERKKKKRRKERKGGRANPTPTCGNKVT